VVAMSLIAASVAAIAVMACFAIKASFEVFK
jgi:hypothetical protein